MGHADSKTTKVYAHGQPSEHEAELAERAFAMRGDFRSSWEARCSTD